MNSAGKLGTGLGTWCFKGKRQSAILLVGLFARLGENRRAGADENQDNRDAIFLYCSF